MRFPLLAALACVLAGAARAQTAPPVPVVSPRQARAPIDYTQPATWLCRPGRAHDACGAADLDAIRVDAAGARTPAPFHAAAEPAIDCFYVYPTVSDAPGDYSDMVAGAREIAVVQSQFARLRAVCRPFAPLYRQLTLAGLGRRLRHSGPEADMWDPAYADVLAAWRDYLARDNGGRGVVLVGHSQGTILLQRLLAREIDGKPVQRLLVSAFLAGDPGLSVAPGKDTGGTFATIPVCHARTRTRCVYAWSAYAKDDASTSLNFGRAAPGLTAVCVDPAAPGGGGAQLKTFLHKPPGAPAGDPPWVEAVGGFTAECRADPQGAVMRVSVAAGPYADLRQALLTTAQHVPGWGLHVLDVNLVQGDVIDDIAAQAQAWAAAGR